MGGFEQEGSPSPTPTVGRPERTGPGRSGIICSYWKAGRSCIQASLLRFDISSNVRFHGAQYCTTSSSSTLSPGFATHLFQGGQLKRLPLKTCLQVPFFQNFTRRVNKLCHRSPDMSPPFACGICTCLQCCSSPRRQPLPRSFICLPLQFSCPSDH